MPRLATLSTAVAFVLAFNPVALGETPPSAAGMVSTFADRDPNWAEATPKPVSKGNPGNYPAYAATLSLEGSATIGFLIDQDGNPKNTLILGAEPAGVFEAACLDYVATFRYAPQTNKSTGKHKRRWSYTCHYKLGP